MTTLRTSGRAARRDLAHQLAREYQVPYPLAFAAVRAGVVDRCRELAAGLVTLDASAAQRSAAFVSAVETLTTQPYTLDMSDRPLTHRIHPGRSGDHHPQYRSTSNEPQ